jgi:hypothetical protein
LLVVPVAIFENANLVALALGASGGNTIQG